MEMLAATLILLLEMLNMFFCSPINAQKNELILSRDLEIRIWITDSKINTPNEWESDDCRCYSSITIHKMEADFFS